MQQSELVGRSYLGIKQWRFIHFISLSLVLVLSFGFARASLGQDASDSISPGAQGVSEETLDDLRSGGNSAPASQPPSVSNGINFLSLLLQGGWFMVPIAIMSILVVTMTLERFIGTRRSKVIPSRLVRGLGQLAREQDALDPKAAYRLCQQYPSAASTVIRTMLLKVGRPHSEIEHAVAEASQREADRMYANVRWLNLAAAISPLLGLLGTVWGMIQAFYDTTQLAPGQNKAESLAQGIYIALVTTLAGLAVAIPAAIFSHFFEGRITSLFRRLDEFLFHLLPQVERYEGRMRFSGGESKSISKSDKKSDTVLK